MKFDQLIEELTNNNQNEFSVVIGFNRIKELPTLEITTQLEDASGNRKRFSYFVVDGSILTSDELTELSTEGEE